MSLNRKTIFERAAKKMRSDFDEISNVPHSALKGAEAEWIVRRFLSDHLPKRFDIGSGFILDPKDSLSKQMDVVVYDALNCPVFRVSDSASIYPSDNVAAAIEVKSRLTKKELEDSAKKIRSAKRLAKSKGPKVQEIGENSSWATVDISQSQFDVQHTIGIVFAFSSALKLTTISNHLDRIIREQGGLGHHIDFVVVLDKGMIILCACVPGHEGWSPTYWSGIGGPQAEGVHIGIGTHPLKEDTLDGFLRMLIAYLTFFRPIVSHPGFSWEHTASKGVGVIHYLTSITTVLDPEERKARLARYANDVKMLLPNPEIPKEIDI